MKASRSRFLLPAATLALAVGFSSAALGNAPVPPDPEPPVANPLPEGVSAPMKVTFIARADGQAVLVIPRKLIDGAGAAGAEAPAAKSDALSVIATVAGGMALSLGVLALGVYLVRRANGRMRPAVAGTAAALLLFVGGGVVFADLLPFSKGNRPPRESQPVTTPGPAVPKPAAPQVKFVIVEEGDTIELTLPRTFLPQR